MINNTHTSFDFLHTIFFSQNTWFFFIIYTLDCDICAHTWFYSIITLDFFTVTWFSMLLHLICTWLGTLDLKVSLHLIFYPWFFTHDLHDRLHLIFASSHTLISIMIFFSCVTWFLTLLHLICTWLVTLDFKVLLHLIFCTTIHFLSKMMT